MCATDVGSDDELRHHLADAHGLEDDDGARSSIGDLRELIYESSDDDKTLDLSSKAKGPRIYDQSADDAKWYPVCLGVGGVLLALLVLLVLL